MSFEVDDEGHLWGEAPALSDDEKEAIRARYIELALFDLGKEWSRLSILYYLAIGEEGALNVKGLQEQIKKILNPIDFFMKGQSDRSDFQIMDFCARIHDLRNILTIVSNYLELILLRPSDKERIFLTINTALERGRLLFDPDHFLPLKTTLAGLKSLSGAVVHEKELPNGLENKTPAIQFVQLLRIFENCIINAKKHGGANLVDFRFQLMDESGVRVLISDDGTGFKGVDPFGLREDQISEGHGYAVAHARRTLESVGGKFYPLDIHAEKGATWVMELPFKEAVKK